MREAENSVTRKPVAWLHCLCLRVASILPILLTRRLATTRTCTTATGPSQSVLNLQAELALTLAGVRFQNHHEDNATATSRNAMATIHLVVVAQLFNALCIGFFQHLLVLLEEPNNGLFGPVSTCFGTVETNG